MDVLAFHFFPNKCYSRTYAVVGCKVYGDVWVHVYAFWVHVYGSVGCMYAVVGCKVCGDVWVQSMRMLGASFITAEGLPDSR